jgi:hypothetical protein
MLFFFSEWVSFISASIITVFLFFDEEPFFDPTDWNIVHVFLFLTCCLIVIWENVVRARYGQFVYKDQVLLFSTFSFWFALENYSRLIVIIFCFHCLTPLELELVELVEVFQSVVCWYTAEILPCLIALSIVLVLIIFLNFFLNWHQFRMCVLLVFLITFILISNLLFVVWDFISSSLSSCLFNSNPKQFYIQNRTTLSYNMSLASEDAYDWHISQPQTFVFRFEDVYFFYLQLFNVVALYSCVFVWLFFLQDILIISGESTRGSFTFLGVCSRWVDHAVWCFVYSHVSVLLVGLRLWLRISTELNIWTL